jgi:CBS domain-containing protein
MRLGTGSARFAGRAMAVSEQQELSKGGVMTKIADVMTDRPRAITPETSIREAARLMEEENVGSLPVVDEGARLVGIVTDRDIAIRAVGHGLEPEGTSVMDIASQEVYALTPDDDLDDALEMMARAQVRRIPIIVRENELVGMVAQADIARTSKEKRTGEVIEAISRPPRGPRVAGADVSEADRRRDVAPERGVPAPESERSRRDQGPDASR